MASRKYQEYLNSAQWRALRRKILARAGHKCEGCGEAGLLEIHHKTYSRIYEERLGDLLALCPGCHREADERRRRDKAVNTYMTKAHGKTWRRRYDWSQAVAEFSSWLARRYQMWPARR